MPDHTDNKNSDKIVLDNQKLERRWWSCLGETCSRSLTFFMPFSCNSLYHLLLLLAHTFGQNL